MDELMFGDFENSENTTFWQNEDELPNIPDEVYMAMYGASCLNFVRLFPYIKILGQKFYLVNLDERYEKYLEAKEK